MTNKQISLVVSMILIFVSNSAMARQWFIEPEVQLSGGYEDNPSLVSDSDIAAGADEEDSESFGELGVRLRLGSEQESDLIAFDAAAFARRYDDSDLDTDRLLAALLYEKSGQKHDLRLRTGYVERNSVSSFLGDPAADIVLDDSGRFSDDRDQEEFFIRPVLISRYSASWLGRLSAGYRDVSFDEPVDRSTEFEEFIVGYELRRILSERTSVYGNLNLLLYRPTESIELGEVVEENTADLQFGVDYLASERVTLFFSAGPGYFETDVLTIEGERSFDDTTQVYTGGIVFTGQLSSFTASFSSGFESVGIGAGVTESERFTIGYSRSDIFGGEFGFRASYLSRDPVLGLTSEREYFSLTPSMAWDINQNLSLVFSIQYREEEIFELADNSTDTADSTVYRIGARYNWGRKLFKP